MADVVVALEAADPLALAGSFIPQNSAITINQDHATMLKADGDIEKYSAVFNVMTSGVTSYRFKADSGLGTALTNLVGGVENAYLVTELVVTCSNIDWPDISFTYHQHTNNAHAAGNEYAVSGAMIALITGALGAYDFTGKASATVTPESSTYTLRLNHIDDLDATGNHWVGSNVAGEEEISVTYLGNADTPTTVADWKVDAAAETDGNQAHDRSTVTARKLVLRT